MAPPAQTPPSRTEPIKNVVETVQALFAIVGLLAAGWWFWAQDFTKKEIKIDQQVTQRRLEGSDKWLMFVDVRVTNTGKVFVPLTGGTLSMFMVNPEPASDSSVPPLPPIPLANLNLEPGESDQALFQSIHVPATVKTIELRATYPVPDSKLSWTAYSVVDIGAPANNCGNIPPNSTCSITYAPIAPTAK